MRNKVKNWWLRTIITICGKLSIADKDGHAMIQHVESLYILKMVYVK